MQIMTTYQKLSIVVAMLIAMVSSYTIGYRHALSIAHREVITAGYAEYNPLTGKCELRKEADIVMAATVLGRVK
jgi:hypothetical protein